MSASVKRHGVVASLLVGLALALFGGAQLLARTGGDDGKKAPAAKSAPAKPDAAARKAAAAARIAAFKQQFGECKTSLASAIAAAEASTKGRAHAADVEFSRDHKLSIVIGLLVDDQFVEVGVDPASGKVSPAKSDDADSDEDEDDREDDGEDDGEEDDD